MVIIPFDLETTARGPDNSPEAHHRANEVVLAGWIDAFDEVETGTLQQFLEYISNLQYNDEDILLVAHNLKFDLKYILREADLAVDFWCTMGAEYLITGHRDKFISLEKCADKYGIAYKKTLDLGAYIKSGGKIEDIPEKDLREYLEGDVRTVNDVYERQMAKIKAPSSKLERLEGLIREQGAFIRNLAHMELNGLYIDREYFKNALTVADKRLKDIEGDILVQTEKALGTYLHPKLNPLAPRTISALLTGTPDQIRFPAKKHPDIKVRSGVLSDEIINKVWGSGYIPNPTTGYSTSEKVLRELFDITGMPYIELLLEYRKLNKLVSTYYGPFLEQTTDNYPIIHPTLNYASTDTGRLSSSNPNGQNMPREVRKGITTRFAGSGQIIEIDFKQLEVVVLAWVTGDPQLIEDLRNGRDVHYEVGKSVMGWTSPSDMDKETRRTVKGVVFGLIYGGGINTLAEQGGTTKQIAKDIVDAFYTRYPKVREWQGNFHDEVLSNKTPAGFKEGWQVYESLTGEPNATRRLWSFYQKPSPVWLRQKTGDKYSFTPTQTKNWPIQGIAGGDIVPRYINLLEKEILKTPDHLILTVHDSVLLDTDYAYTNEDFQDLADLVGEELELPVPLVVEIEKGKNWK